MPKKTTVHKGIRAFWQRAIDAGEKPPPVYAVVHKSGSTQPEGYIQAYDVSEVVAGHILSMAKRQDSCELVQFDFIPTPKRKGKLCVR